MKKILILLSAFVLQFTGLQAADLTLTPDTGDTTVQTTET